MGRRCTSTLLIAGVDEVGRGPLAGPVVSAVVILNPKLPIEGLADSKVLTAKRREYLYWQIKERALYFSIGRAEVFEIDEINILQATMLSMQRAVAGLPVIPSKIFVDGNRCPELPCEAESIIKGDSKVAEISAASILAKVTRDAEMVQLHQHYPDYGFDCHKGYPTKLHRERIKVHGVTKHHRRSFRPVAEVLARQ
ncbi:MAG TPA: ribonuclease HII [Gammaproteobacteria bacterium]|nr:ribonuclease HII [Gammaproteobacteria bacterium]